MGHESIYKDYIVYACMAKKSTKARPAHKSYAYHIEVKQHWSHKRYGELKASAR